MDEKKRKNELARLVSACSDIRKYVTSGDVPGNSDDWEDLQYRLYKNFYDKSRIYLDSWFYPVQWMERKIREEAEQEVLMLGTKKKMETNCWLGYAGRIKSDVSILDLDAMKAKSPSDILSLLKRLDGLTIGVQKLSEMGTALLNPVPPDLLSWNPSFMYCGSSQAQQNQMDSGQFPQQVLHGN